jgi:hypothetical protein
VPLDHLDRRPAVVGEALDIVARFERRRDDVIPGGQVHYLRWFPEGNKTYSNAPAAISSVMMVARASTRARLRGVSRSPVPSHVRRPCQKRWYAKYPWWFTFTWQAISPIPPVPPCTMAREPHNQELAGEPRRRHIYGTRAWPESYGLRRVSGPSPWTIGAVTQVHWYLMSGFS